MAFRTIIVAGMISLLLVVRAKGHEHHEDNIPEGEVVSADPIVSSAQLSKVKMDDGMITKWIPMTEPILMNS